MSTRNPRSGSDDQATGDALAPLNMLADLPRRQMALMTQSASAMLRGSDSLRKIQQAAAQRALAQQEQVAERLRAPVDFNELLTIQAELLRFNLQEAAQYWQQLTTTALKVQAEMISNAGAGVDTGAEPTLDSLQRAFEASLNDTAAADQSH